MTPALLLGGVGVLALLAAAFSHGYHLGGLKARAELLMLPVRSSARAALVGALRPTPQHKPAPGRGSGVLDPGSLLALSRLRSRLDFGLAEVAQALGVPVADVETIEATPLRRLDVGTVERFASAVGCRLDVVAQHIDGEAIWLSDDRGAL